MKNLLLTCFLLVFFTVTNSSIAQSGNISKVQKPRLVVGIVVDQMRWDYLERYRYRFGKDGFNRMLNQGFSFNQTYIPYSPSVTAVGHASVYSGAYPAVHGIMGNEWVNRSSGEYTYCVADTNVKSVGGSMREGRMSPKNLVASTIGDQLKLASNLKSRVFGVGLKDRGAILPAGRMANAAYWFCDSTGNFITSTWYSTHLPQWVNAFNQLRLPDDYYRKGWKLLEPETAYLQSTADNSPHESPIGRGFKTHFPYRFDEFIGKNYRALRYTPHGNKLTFQFAQRLIEEEQLGKHEQTDLLAISVSSTDYIGHKFGIHSMETEDTYVRLDRDLAAFFRFLDQQIGKDMYTVFLTADHAAPGIPDLLKEYKLHAGHINMYRMVDTLNAFLEKRIGIKKAVSHYFEYQFFLNNLLLDSVKADVASIKKEIINYLHQLPEVFIAVDYDQLHNALIPAEMKEAIVRGYYRGRSGDFHLILKPFVQDYLGKGTQHGSLYTYDTHIPLLFYGTAIKKGRSFSRVYMTDIAPTICALLGIQAPNGAFGNVLEEVLEGRSGRK